MLYAPDLVAMQNPDLTVYHDGSCPVCRLEIGHFKRQPGAERIDFVDVSDPDVDTGSDLPRSKAQGRFHVRLPSGELRSGGAAFVEIWNVLPLYTPAALLARLPGATSALNIGYKIASPIRPWAARLIRHVA